MSETNNDDVRGEPAEPPAPLPEKRIRVRQTLVWVALNVLSALIAVAVTWLIGLLGS